LFFGLPGSSRPPHGSPFPSNCLPRYSSFACTLYCLVQERLVWCLFWGVAFGCRTWSYWLLVFSSPVVLFFRGRCRPPTGGFIPPGAGLPLDSRYPKVFFVHDVACRYLLLPQVHLSVPLFFIGISHHVLFDLMRTPSPLALKGATS